MKKNKYFLDLEAPIVRLAYYLPYIVAVIGLGGGIFLLSRGIIWGWILVSPALLYTVFFTWMWWLEKQLFNGSKTCPHCNGTGVKEYCPYCEGKGRIKKEK